MAKIEKQFVAAHFRMGGAFNSPEDEGLKDVLVTLITELGELMLAANGAHRFRRASQQEMGKILQDLGKILADCRNFQKSASGALGSAKGYIAAHTKRSK